MVPLVDEIVEPEDAVEVERHTVTHVKVAVGLVVLHTGSIG
jgi:hypothetical protein